MGANYKTRTGAKIEITTRIVVKASPFSAEAILFQSWRAYLLYMDLNDTPPRQANGWTMEGWEWDGWTNGRCKG